MKTTLLYATKTIEHSVNPENEAFIFVYGTLLKGQSNYERFLAPAEPEMRGEIEGFDMFELGYFPGVVKGNGRVKGEVYKVSREQLNRIDSLEGEGVLYKKEKVTVQGYCLTERVEAYVYIYLGSVNGCMTIPYESQPYKNEYVWYVAYGSNMSFERFKYYLEGGYYERNGKDYLPCEDDTLPTESVGIEIPYDMYFSNYNQGSWEGSAVSFLDVTHGGYTIARAYLIKKSQVNHIHGQEGRGANWYPDTIELADIMGIPAITFTNKQSKRYSPMSEISIAYASTIIDGYMEMGESAEYAIESIMLSTSLYSVNGCWTKEDADYAYANSKKGA